MDKVVGQRDEMRDAQAQPGKMWVWAGSGGMGPRKHTPCKVLSAMRRAWFGPLPLPGAQIAWNCWMAVRRFLYRMRCPQLWQRMGSPALTAVSWLQSPHTYFTSARFSSSPTAGAAAGVVDAEEALDWADRAVWADRAEGAALTAGETGAPKVDGTGLLGTGDSEAALALYAGLRMGCVAAAAAGNAPAGSGTEQEQCNEEQVGGPPQDPEALRLGGPTIPQGRVLR
eukprot:EG_transcript_13973